MTQMSPKLVFLSFWARTTSNEVPHAHDGRKYFKWYLRSLFRVFHEEILGGVTAFPPPPHLSGQVGGVKFSMFSMGGNGGREYSQFSKGSWGGYSADHSKQQNMCEHRLKFSAIEMSTEIDNFRHISPQKSTFFDIYRPKSPQKSTFFDIYRPKSPQKSTFFDIYRHISTQISTFFDIFRQISTKIGIYIDIFWHISTNIGKYRPSIPPKKCRCSRWGDLFNEFLGVEKNEFLEIFHKTVKFRPSISKKLFFQFLFDPFIPFSDPNEAQN